MTAHVTPASSSVGVSRRWLRSKSQAGDQDCNRTEGELISMCPSVRAELMGGEGHC